MSTQTVRLPNTLSRRLERLARSSGRSKTAFMREALERYLDEREDLEIALARIRDPDAEWLDHAEVKRALGIR